MEKLLGLVCAIVLIFGITGIGNANLINRDGGLIYCDTLDITWLQDAKYVYTSGYPSTGSYTGRLTWKNVITWAETLEYYDPVRDVTWGTTGGCLQP